MHRIARILLCLLCCALGVEVAVRVDDRLSYGAPLLGNFNYESLFEYDHLGKRGKPYARYLKWQMNSLGLRGPELRPGSRRIGVVGSSETFGLYERPGGEWPRRLESLLNQAAAHPPVDVVNFALPGMLLSTFQRRLAQWVELVRPHAVVFYPSPTGYLYYHEAQSPEARQAPKQRPELRITARAQQVLKDVLPDRIENWLRKRQARRIFAATAQVMESAPESLIDSYRADVAAVVGELRQRGIEPVLVTHATYFGARVDPSERAMMIAWRKFYPMLKEDGFLNLEARANDALRAVASAERVALVDAAARMPSGTEYFADFVHFTDRGAELFAAMVAEALKK